MRRRIRRFEFDPREFQFWQRCKFALMVLLGWPCAIEYVWIRVGDPEDQ